MYRHQFSQVFQINKYTLVFLLCACLHAEIGTFCNLLSIRFWQANCHYQIKLRCNPCFICHSYIIGWKFMITIAHNITTWQSLECDITCYELFFSVGVTRYYFSYLWRPSRTEDEESQLWSRQRWPLASALFLFVYMQAVMGQKDPGPLSLACQGCTTSPIVSASLLWHLTLRTDWGGLMRGGRMRGGKVSVCMCGYPVKCDTIFIAQVFCELNWSSKSPSLHPRLQGS